MSRQSAILHFAALFLSAASVALAQNPRPSPASLTIAGRVVAAHDDVALRRARVDIHAGSERFNSVLTDDQAQFAVAVSGAGPFTITVSKAGFILATTTLTRAEAARRVVVRLPLAAAISGRVTDQNGRPLEGARIAAARAAGDNPPAGLPPEFTTLTDDLGEYRLFGLSAGRYEVRTASPAGAVIDPAVLNSLWADTRQRVLREIEATGGGTVIGALAPSSGPAQVVTVQAGDDVGSVDFNLGAPPSIGSTTLRQLLEGVPAVDGRIILPDGSGRIRGRVTTSTGDAVPSADVRLSGPRIMRLARTDPNGAFVLEALLPGTYTLSVARRGSPALEYGQNPSFGVGRTIELAGGQTLNGIDFVLPQELRVSGTLVDEHGEPVQDGAVRALRLQDVSGQLVATGVGFPRRTDDRGRFRLSGLLPGRYVIVASIDAVIADADRPEPTGYAASYHPGTPAIASATQFELTTDLAGANIVLAPSRVVHVRGRAFDGDTPLTAGTARLTESRRSTDVSPEPRSAPLATDGTFMFPNVPAGEYAVQVMGLGPGQNGLFGMEYVRVDDTDLAPLSIATSKGVTLEGRIVVEEPADLDPCPAPPAPRAGGPCSIGATASAFTVQPTTTDPDRARSSGFSVVVSGDGTFYITGLFGPMAFSLLSAPTDDWHVKSVVIDGRDVTDSGYDFGATARTIADAEIVVSRHGGTLTGSVTDGSQRVDSYAVVVFSVDQRRRAAHSTGLRMARPQPDGTFRLTGLPPGDYYVVAVNRLEGTRTAGEWQSATLLEQLSSRAERVTIDERSTRTITLRRIAR